MIREEQDPNSYIISSADESTLSSRKFLIDVDKTIASLLEREDTDQNMEITIEDVGPKVSNLAKQAVLWIGTDFSRSCPSEQLLHTAITSLTSEAPTCCPTSSKSSQ